MKTFLSLASVALLVVLSGCGQKKEETPATETTTEAAAPAAATEPATEGETGTAETEETKE